MEGKLLGKYMAISTAELIRKLAMLGITAGGGGGATTFTGLSDTPGAYTGASLQAVRVNAGETGLEFYTPSGGGSVLYLP